MNITLFIAAASSAASSTHRLEIDGVPYRVTVQGQTVEVARKTAFVRWNIEERDRQRRAIIAITGCQPVDELPEAAKLRAKLDCRPNGQ